MSCPKERLQNLTQKEREMLKDEVAVNKFCANGTLESLLFILIKLGFEVGLSIGPTQEAIEKAIAACTYQYDSGMQRLDAIEVAKIENVCVVSSRHVMETIMMCAQNCSTDVYKLTYVSKNLKSISGPAHKKPYDIQTKEVSDNLTTVNRLMMEQLIALSYASDILGLSINKILLLSALFNKRHSAMTMAELAKVAQMEDKKKYIGRDLEELVASDYVTSDRPKKKYAKMVHYMINTRGIQIIGEYHNYIWERTLKQ